MAFVISFVSCIKNDNDCCNGDVIGIQVSIRNNRITGNTFDTGDQIGIYAAISPGIPDTGNYLNNTVYTYDGTSWDAPEGLPIPWPDSENLDVYGYWPYDADLTSGNPHAYPFLVNTDQTSSENYISNDFLWAKSVSQTSGQPVPLLFSHILSRVQINIRSSFDGGTDWPAQAEVAILGLSGAMTIDLSDGSITPAGSSEKLLPGIQEEKNYYSVITSGSETVRRDEDEILPLVLNAPYLDYDLSLAAIVMPQNVVSGESLVRITLDDTDYIFTPEEDFSFTPGETLSINLTLLDRVKGVRAEPGILSVDENGVLNLDGRGYIVYFKWGSAIAVYGYEPDHLFAGREDIAWIPPQFDIEKITGTGTAAWDLIAYPNSAMSYPDRTNSTDIANGYGDPCQFAEMEGETGNFRVPNNPYEQFVNGALSSDYNGIAGRWSDYGTINSQFYPFAGRIYDGNTLGINTNGYFWSGQGLSVGNAYTLSITNTTTNLSSSLWKGYGLPVRCVRKTD